MFIRLSYDVEEDAPSWPGNPTPEIHSRSSIVEGKLVNHTLFTLFTHFGSHLDTPLHWVANGAAVTDLSIDHFIYTSPAVIDIPKDPKQFITAAEIAAHKAEILGKDCLLIRTGFSKYRKSDPPVYSAEGPALHPEAARYILNTFPSLKAIGTDCVSIASPSMLDEAAETHRVLLGYFDPSRSVVILEDFSLDFDLTALRRVYALPLFIKGAEGSPCTMVAEVDR